MAPLFILKEQGYDVIGVTMQIWQEDKDYRKEKVDVVHFSS